MSTKKMYLIKGINAFIFAILTFISVLGAAGIFTDSPIISDEIKEGYQYLSFMLPIIWFMVNKGFTYICKSKELETATFKPLTKKERKDAKNQAKEKKFEAKLEKIKNKNKIGE